MFYLCWGDSAAGNLKQLNRMQGMRVPILAMLDDLRIGSLSDADHAQPLQRWEWAHRLLRAQWWYNEAEYALPIAQQQQDVHARWHRGLMSAEVLVVWLGNNAHDQLMLMQVAALAPQTTPIDVVDVANTPQAGYLGQYAVGSCAPDSLNGLPLRRLADTERKQLAEKWAYWRHAAKGWRATDVDGNIVDFPVSVHDERLLVGLTAEHMVSAVELVGQVMGIAPGLVPDNFLFWRLDVLRQQGRVVFVPQLDEPQPQPPMVRLS